MYFKKSLKNCYVLNASKVVIFSDLHLGIGNNNDNSLHNHSLLFQALKYYNEQNYVIVLLGDTFELGENNSIQRIFSTHDDIMWLFSEIHKKGNLCIIRGNHDAYIKKSDFLKRFDHYTKKYISFLDNINIYDSIKLNNKFLLIHGHQYSFIYTSIFNRIINWLLRVGYQKLEFAFWKDPTSEAIGKNNPLKVDHLYSKYAAKNNIFIVAGHTHSVCFSLPNYLNIGGGILPRCITCAEIHNKKISSIKWGVEPDQNMYLKIQKNILKNV